MAKNGHFGEKRPKTGFLAIIPHFGVFLGFPGPRGPSPAEGFTSTPVATARAPGAGPDPWSGDLSGACPDLVARRPPPETGDPGSQILPRGGGDPIQQVPGTGSRGRRPGHPGGQLREGGFTSTPRAGALSPVWPGPGTSGPGSGKGPLRGPGNHPARTGSETPREIPGQGWRSGSAAGTPASRRATLRGRAPKDPYGPGSGRAPDGYRVKSSL